MKDEPINHQPYWTAALARHKALIAAGCISPVGALRVAPGKVKDADDDTAAPARGEG